MDSYCFATFYDFLSYLQKVILKITDENSRIRIHYPLARGMDSRIRIRIRAKISWIRNTAGDNVAKSVLGTFWSGGGRLWNDLSISEPVFVNV